MIALNVEEAYQEIHPHLPTNVPALRKALNKNSRVVYYRLKRLEGNGKIHRKRSASGLITYHDGPGRAPPKFPVGMTSADMDKAAIARLPATTIEVAVSLNISDRAAYRRLKRLESRGSIHIDRQMVVPPGGGRPAFVWNPGARPEGQAIRKAQEPSLDFSSITSAMSGFMSVGSS